MWWVCSGVSTLQIADSEDEQMMALSWARAPLSVKTNQAIMQLAGRAVLRARVCSFVGLHGVH